MITITCDNCSKILDHDELITIGSSSGTDLKFKNTTDNGKEGLNIMENNPDLHFCNKDCFINFFFNE